MAINPPTSSSAVIIKKLSILIEINQALSRNLNLQESLYATLKILQESYNVKYGMICLIDESDDNLNLVSTLYPTLSSKLNIKKNEGLIGQILRNGKPVIIPRITKELQYQNEIYQLIEKDNKEYTFYGIPIMLDYQSLGALLILLAYNPRRDYNTTLDFFSLVASALLQPIRVDRTVSQERQRLMDENVSLKYKLQDEFSFRNIIGTSHEMRDVFEQVTRIAATDTTVMIRGESGTGKELIAKAIHYNSTRSDKPFIRVNCAAIPENLIESEFFGYEKGAFTGAMATKKGRFELADKGTIFLDEVGDLSLMTQVKLLRVLQEQEFERVGGTETIKVDVRIIAATNQNIEQLMDKGKFREDLYYRLNVFSIFLPPLRERKTDILLLADHFMLKYGRKYKKPVKRISTPAIDMLMRYHWPGNVRELENCIERSVLICEDQVLHSYHLPPTLQTAESSNTVPQLSLQEAVTSYEKELIQDVLKSTNGNKAKAARLLNTTERVIGYKIEKFNINVKRFKS
jgi:Nif-specific regulatory protein